LSLRDFIIKDHFEEKPLDFFMVRRPKDSMTHKITITKNSNTSFMQIKRPILNENRLTI